MSPNKIYFGIIINVFLCKNSPTKVTTEREDGLHIKTLWS